MSDRYNKRDKFRVDTSAFSKPYQAPAPQKHDPLADFLRFAGGVAPAVGTGIGALVGGLTAGVPTAGAAAPLGVAGGAGIGGAIGAGLGGLATGGADMIDRPASEEARRKDAETEELAARHRAALSLLGGMR